MKRSNGSSGSDCYRNCVIKDNYQPLCIAIDFIFEINLFYLVAYTSHICLVQIDNLSFRFKLIIKLIGCIV